MRSIKVREASFADEKDVQRLCLRNDLEGERCDHAWKWIWGNNRFYKKGWPIGWVLESDGEVVGFIGNIPRAYSFKGSDLIAGVARSFVIDKLFRAHSFKLIVSFFRQKDADLLIVSSANSESEAIYRLARASCIPQQDYHRDLFWIVTPRSFSVSLFKKKGVGELLSVVASWIILPIISLEMFIRMRWADYPDDDIEMMTLTKLTCEIDELWRKLQKENPNKLLSYRDKEAIAWQFHNESAKSRDPVLFVIRKDGILKGYAIITREDSPEYSLKRMMITDLIVLDNDPEIIRSLVNKVFIFSKQKKLDVLQMKGFPLAVRRALNSLHPFEHTHSHSSFFYYVSNPELKDHFKNESTWYASTFDGDSSL